LSALGKAALLARVWLVAVRVWFAVRRHSLDEVAATLGETTAEPRVSTALLSRAVSRGLRVGSWQPRCLVRSLVLYRLLRAQGDPAELVIGLPIRPRNHEAHSWVELAGRDVGPAPGSSGYLELTRYPRDGG
jgi:hypothetical protein